MKNIKTHKKTQNHIIRSLIPSNFNNRNCNTNSLKDLNKNYKHYSLMTKNNINNNLHNTLEPIYSIRNSIKQSSLSSSKNHITTNFESPYQKNLEKKQKKIKVSEKISMFKTKHISNNILPQKFRRLNLYSYSVIKKNRKNTLIKGNNSYFSNCFTPQKQKSFYSPFDDDQHPANNKNKKSLINHEPAKTISNFFKSPLNKVKLNKKTKLTKLSHLRHSLINQNINQNKNHISIKNYLANINNKNPKFCGSHLNSNHSTNENILFQTEVNCTQKNKGNTKAKPSNNTSSNFYLPKTRNIFPLTCKTNNNNEHLNKIINKFKDYANNNFEPSMSKIDKAINNISENIKNNPFFRKIVDLNEVNKFERLFNNQIKIYVDDERKKKKIGFFMGDLKSNSGKYICENRSNVFNISDIIDKLSPISVKKFSGILNQSCLYFFKNNNNQKVKSEDKLRTQLINKFREELWYQNQIAEKFHLKKNTNIKYKTLFDDYKDNCE